MIHWLAVTLSDSSFQSHQQEIKRLLNVLWPRGKLENTTRQYSTIFIYHLESETIFLSKIWFLSREFFAHIPPLTDLQDRLLLKK